MHLICSRYRILSFLLLILGASCLSSCQADRQQPSSGTEVSFTSGGISSCSSGTRSTMEEIPSTVTALQGGSSPLYLHTLYTDSIASPSLEWGNNPSSSTRAAHVTPHSMYSSFGVSAYSYSGSWNESRTPNFLYNATASKSGNNYILTPSRYWPGSSYKMRFFAYAPKDNQHYVLSGLTAAGSPTVSVTVPSAVDEQLDLLVAKTDELNGNSNTVVPLAFKHVLTAIKIESGDDMQGGTIKSVSLKNVYSKGVYNMGLQSWSGIGTPATFSQTLDKAITGTPGEEFTSEAQTFMMIPQTLPDGAILEVIFTDSSNVDHTLTAKIQGSVWPMGKTVTYKISSSSINWTYKLEVSALNDYTYLGGTQSYSVTSYRERTTNGAREPYQWTTQYSTDNGASWTTTQPEWLIDFTSSGAGGETPQSYDATVETQLGVGPRHTHNLQNAAPKGSENAPYNLANQTNGGQQNENTANCYIVSAPGYYSLPLVYGNAIKGSVANESAYKTNNVGSDILSHFVNHTGNRITNPYIIGNANCYPASAELVWQDAPGLVSNITYNGTGLGTISFYVDPVTIQQGNAVIAIKDAQSNILWSWHIWVTDEDINNTIEVTNAQGYKYNLAPINLGWDDGGTTTYAERSCLVKFTAGSASKTITIKQAPAAVPLAGNSPYYSWGRKDPLPPSTGLSNTGKTWYDKDGQANIAVPLSSSPSPGINFIKYFIQHPMELCNKQGGDGTYKNLWSIDNNGYTSNDNLVIKTIYDPCPVGFKLPPSNAFTGFTINGNNSSAPSSVNGSWDSTVKGWHFYTNSSKTTTIFFPASGYRHYKMGFPSAIGRFGYYPTATPYDTKELRYLYFYDGSVSPTWHNYREYGFPIRPMRE